MIAQLQVLDLKDPDEARRRVLDHQAEILAEVDGVDPVIAGLGGGARDLDARILRETAVGPMLIVHLIFDVPRRHGRQCRQHRRRAPGAA